MHLANSPSQDLTRRHNYAMSDEAADAATMEGVKVLLQGTLEALQAKTFNTSYAAKIVEEYTDFMSDWLDDMPAIQKRLGEVQ